MLVCWKAKVGSEVATYLQVLAKSCGEKSLYVKKPNQNKTCRMVQTMKNICSILSFWADREEGVCLCVCKPRWCSNVREQFNSCGVCLGPTSWDS